jgi:23S rRNA pseudouridine1911/1915/1917 synthase
MADRFVAAAAGPLFEQLTAQLPDWGRNTLRSRLQLGCILVNGEVVRRHDHALVAGDVVTIRAKAEGRTVPARGGLPILFADEDLVAIDKPVGLLSVSTANEQERTAMVLLGEQLAPGRGVALWPAHRLDRETSGVLLFARSREARDTVQARWADAAKLYVAIVDGCPEPADGVIDAPLWEDKNLRVRVGDHPEARPARTRYRTTARSRPGSRAQLEVELDTGRKHQIRAHLAWRGHPIVGDDRYGTPAPRLCLHALRLTLPHPRTGAPLVLTAPLPPALPAALASG